MNYKNKTDCTSATRPKAWMLHNGLRLMPLAMLMMLTLGCGPWLQTQQTIDLKPDDIRTILIDAIGSDQTVTITAQSDSEFSIHVHLGGDEQDVDTAISLGKGSDKILAERTKTKEATLEVNIPADKEGAIRFQCEGRETATVTYTISN